MMGLKNRIYEIYNIYPFCDINVTTNLKANETYIVVKMNFRGDELTMRSTTALSIDVIEEDPKMVEHIYRDTLNMISLNIRNSYDRCKDILI